MGIAIVEAARLSKANRAHRQQLVQRHVELTERLDRERDAQELIRTDVHHATVVPFCDAFARLKNVELTELGTVSMPDAVDLPTGGNATIRISGVNGLAAAAGGMAVGAGAGSATLAGVGALATASTGTSIASLSGAAATNATLAWLGGGSLAAGGGGVAAGTLVLTGVVAVPVLLAGTGFLTWEGRRELRHQRTTNVTLVDLDTALVRDERRCAAVVERSRELRVVLACLRERVDRLLVRFTALVERADDYTTYSPAERTLVMTLVRLVSTATTVMSTPPADGDGRASERSRQVVVDARSVLDELDAQKPAA